MMKIFLTMSLVAALAACATSSPDVIQRGDAQRLSQVVDATVLTIRSVTVDGNQSTDRKFNRMKVSLAWV